jgi:uncharacterized protein (DUF433 family)
VNKQLVESLASAIAALPTEDYVLFQETLIGKMINKTPGVAGGLACIRNTRITVWTIVSLMDQGADDQELLRNFPGLNSFDLAAVRSYYKTSKEEIDGEIESHHQEDGWDG